MLALRFSQTELCFRFGDGVCHFQFLLAPRFDVFKDDRQNRKQNDDDNHFIDVIFEQEIFDAENTPRELLDQTAEKITGEQHTDDPEKPAENIVKQELAIRHLRSTRDNRGERADDGNKAGDNDSFAAVLFVKRMRLFNMLRIKNSRFLAREQRLAHFFAGQITDRVADDGGDEQRNHQNGEIHFSGGSEKSGDDEQGIAGQKKSDCQARFGENDQKERDVNVNAEHVEQTVDHDLRIEKIFNLMKKI